jgi:hypothetical protein
MSWVKEALGRHGRLEAQLGVQIGELLGCGGWGCVFDTNTHWVVKLTLDPREVAAWNWLDRFTHRHGDEAAGVARVGDLVELSPRVYDPDSRSERSAFLVLREKVEPLPDETRRRPGFVGYHRFRTRGWHDDQAVALVRILDRYMELSKLLSRAILPWSKRDYAERLVGVMQDLEVLHDDTVPLAQTLFALHEEHFLVGDLHPGNLGWRVADNIGGRRLPAGLIVTDPESLERHASVPSLPVYRVNRNGIRPV